jgi:hypothetical protein
MPSPRDRVPLIGSSGKVLAETGRARSGSGAEEGYPEVVRIFRTIRLLARHRAQLDTTSGQPRGIASIDGSSNPSARQRLSRISAVISPSHSRPRKLTLEACEVGVAAPKMRRLWNERFTEIGPHQPLRHGDQEAYILVRCLRADHE